MTELDELELDPKRDPAGAKARGPGGTSRRPLLWLIPVLLIAAALIFYFFFFHRDPQPERPAVAEAPAAEVAPEAEEEEAEPEIELPPLDGSDALVRELVGALSSHPRLAALLIPDGLVRRFTAAADNVAEGVSPRPHFRSLLPAGDFQTKASGARNRTAPESFRRWDVFADVISSLDAAGCARLYETLKPLIGESYRDLGYPDGDFDLTLRKAIHHLLLAPTPTGKEILEPQVAHWSYADPRLEALSPAQKDLFRMGPRNVPVIQAKLEEIARALGIPDSELGGAG